VLLASSLHRRIPESVFPVLSVSSSQRLAFASRRYGNYLRNEGLDLAIILHGSDENIRMLNLGKILISLFVVLAVKGCFGFKSFQPNPDLYKNWKKRMPVMKR
jgi:hypothetical protein